MVIYVLLTLVVIRLREAQYRKFIQVILVQWWYTSSSCMWKWSGPHRKCHREVCLSYL